MSDPSVLEEMTYPELRELSATVSALIEDFGVFFTLTDLLDKISDLIDQMRDKDEG